MTDLIEIKTDKKGIQTVSARLLHEKLGIATHFSDWIKRMIEYGFEENKDFTIVQNCTLADKNEYGAVLKNEYGAVVKNGDGIAIRNEYGRNKKGQFTSIDYFITLDMAKEICMVQRSDIGKKFRQYFIRCEKALTERTELRNKSKHVRNNFTDTLKEHGYTKAHEYIQTTKQMKNALGITAKKAEMTNRELNLVLASENVATCAITDEQGYNEVNPVCIDASEAVANFLAERKQKRLESKRA